MELRRIDMQDKLKTIETKRARRAKHYAPKLDIRALESELRKENNHAVRNNSSYRLDFGRMVTNEGGAK